MVTSSVAKIIFVVAEVTFKVVVITSSVVKITFVVAEITFKVAVITFPVVKITLKKWLYTIESYHEREVLLARSPAVYNFQLFLVITKKSWKLFKWRDKIQTWRFVILFLFNRYKILCIHVKTLDSDFQLISKILVDFFLIWVLIGHKCEVRSIFLHPTNVCNMFK